jgi:hypothetical protein
MQATNRPFLIKAFNLFKIPSSLNRDDLLNVAKKKTAITDFDNKEFIEGFEILLDSINKEAQLHPFGKFITKQRLINVLANRLRVEELLKKHPEILKIEIKEPIIVTGLQRTGTTRLHRLLSSHPSIRSLKSWEALNPVPLKNDQFNKQRISFAKTAEKALKYMSPEFFSIHPVEHEAPEEDILINDMTFVSTVPEATMHLPTYAYWVQNQSHLEAYRYVKKILQILTWQNPNARWVLKTPQYLEFLEEANMVFPDAKFIHTYRDPLKVLPSFFSMVYHSRKIFSNQVSASQSARHWLTKNSYMMKKAMHYWSTNSSNNTLHISYYDMLSNPIEEMKKIYAFAGLDFDATAQKNLQDVDQENKQNKYGVHKYALSDFNLTKEDIEKEFELYRTTFKIPYE